MSKYADGKGEKEISTCCSPGQGVLVDRLLRFTDATEFITADYTSLSVSFNQAITYDRTRFHRQHHGIIWKDLWQSMILFHWRMC